MNVKVSDSPVLTITGSNFSAAIPVCIVDDNGWTGAGTTLTVTGLLTDSAQTFMANLRNQSDAWKATLSTYDVLNTKLGGLVGKVL